MKRRELVKTLRQMARARGARIEFTEGGSHTKVRIGDRQTVVPRHREINEITAQKIIEQLGGKR